MTPQESSLTGSGIEQLKSGNYNEAANTFNQALQINQNNVAALTAKGLIAFVYNRDFNQALNYLDQILQIDTNNVIALKGKGIILTDRGNYATRCD